METLTESGVDVTARIRVTLFGVVTGVGVVILVGSSEIWVVSLPIAAFVSLLGVTVYAIGLDQFIAQLSMSKTPLIAYLSGPDPNRIPRWVYFGLVGWSIAFAGSLILLYYAFNVARNLTSTEFDIGWAVALIGLGGAVIRYPMAFLWAYWQEG